jgi:hypothetical protein
MTDSRVLPLAAFAAHLRQQQVDLTERWMKAVFNDVELTESDRLTYEQLADHIPNILEEICSVLESQDLDELEPASQRGARWNPRSGATRACTENFAGSRVTRSTNWCASSICSGRC